MSANEPAAVQSATDDPRVLRAVEEYLAARQAGDAPDRAAFLACHADIAPALADCLDGLEFIQAAAPRLQESAGNLTAAGAALVGALPAEGQLGDYRLLREVGRGGMGVVYEAVQESLGRHVALKVLPGHALLAPAHLERFRREARAAALLHHSNIVPVFGVGCEGGVHYYAMQFIHGQSLDRVLHELRRPRPAAAAAPTGPETPRVGPADPAAGLSASLAEGLRFGRLPGSSAPASGPAPGQGEPAVPNSAGTAAGGDTHRAGPTGSDLPGQYGEFFRGVAWVGVQVAEALAYAHRQGILHRDVKPANLMLDAQGTVWVTDFGLAKEEGSGALTGAGDVVGTLRYLAPERFDGCSGPRGDVYSLGATLYELLTLRPAFDEPERARLTERIARGGPPRPRQLDGRIPRDLETIVLKAMAREPAERYVTADALAEDLRRFLMDRPIQARRAGPLERAWRWCRRNRAVAVLLAASLVLAAGMGVLAILLWDKQQQTAAALQQSRASQEVATRRLKQTLTAMDRMLGRAGQPLADVPQTEPLRRALNEDALDLYVGLLQEATSDPELRLDMAHTYFHVAHLRFGVGQPTEAVEARRRGIALAQELVAEAPDRPEYRRALALCLEPGGVSSDKREREVRASLDLWLGLAKEFPANTEYQHHLGLCQRQLADGLCGAGRPAEAERVLRQALATDQKLVTDYSASPWPSIVIEDWSRLGGCLQKLGRVREAEGAYRKTLEEAHKLKAAFPRTATARRWLGTAQRELGALLCTCGRRDEGIELLAQAAAGWREMLQDARDCPPYGEEAGGMEIEMAHLLQEDGRPAEADKAFRQALDDYQAAARTTPDARQKRQCRAQAAAVQRELGVLLGAGGRRKEGRELLAQAIAWYRGMRNEDPACPSYAEGAGTAEIDMGRLLAKDGHPAEAEKAFRQALDDYEAAARTTPDARQKYRCRMQGAWCWDHLGRLWWAQGRFQQAEDARRHGLELSQRLFDEFPQETEQRRLLANSHNNLAWFLAIRPDRQPHHAAEALEHAQKAVDLQPGYHDWWHTLGVAHCRLGHWKEALACIEKSRELEQQPGYKPGPPGSWDRFFEAMAYSGLGDKANARRCYDEGVRWMEEHAPDHPDLHRSRDEAAAMLGMTTGP